MSDWFRCTQWNEQGEAEFFRRLKRARRQSKPQYLVLQALTLVCTGRRELAAVALSLIELFTQDHHDPFFASKAYGVKARALVMLEQWEDALDAFEDALRARRAMPNVVDDTWLDYPLTIALRRTRERYQRALDVLNEFLTPTALVFPLHEFRYFATLALISADEGDREGAARWAKNALAAAVKQAPFARHPDVGIVGFGHADLQIKLEELAGE